jgi:hypothetical protein
MKYALLLLLALSPSAYACPSLAGNWHWSAEDGSGFIDIKIEQNSCVTLDETYDQGWGFTVKHKHVLDGQKHLVENDGDLQVFETAMIDDSALRIDEERHGTDEDGKPEVVHVKITMTQSDAGHLTTTREGIASDGRSDGVETTVYSRKE